MQPIDRAADIERLRGRFSARQWEFAVSRIGKGDSRRTCQLDDSQWFIIVSMLEGVPLEKIARQMNNTRKEGVKPQTVLVYASRTARGDGDFVNLTGLFLDFMVVHLGQPYAYLVGMRAHAQLTRWYQKDKESSRWGIDARAMLTLLGRRSNIDMPRTRMATYFGVTERTVNRFIKDIRTALGYPYFGGAKYVIHIVRAEIILAAMYERREGVLWKNPRRPRLFSAQL